MKTPNFDRVAWAYDTLAKIVFGKAMRKAQAYSFAKIPDNAKVLILGGGTGWIIEMLLTEKPDSHIHYIEASSAMMAKAKYKNTKHLKKVTYILGTQEDIPNDTYFDVVITNFFLDVFPVTQLPPLIQKIDKSLHSKSIWAFTDFQNTPVKWQKWLTRLMNLFFQLTCNLQSKQLSDWNTLFMQHGWVSIDTKTFYHNMIVSTAYHRK